MRREGKQILRQTDANSCLVCSLLFIIEKNTGQRFSESDERQLYFSSFGRCRESFVLSYLLAFKDCFPSLDITLTVDNEHYKKYLEELNDGEIQIDANTITIELIRDKTLGGPLVVFVDRYFFDHEIHIPHYVVVEDQKSGNFLVNDPWWGKALSKTPFNFKNQSLE